MLTNAESGTRHQPTEHRRSSPTDPLRSEPAGTGVDQDDVVQLREAFEPRTLVSRVPREAAPGVMSSRSRTGRHVC
jgi:hypothetical protein